jgi:hypothetical protein
VVVQTDGGFADRALGDADLAIFAFGFAVVSGAEAAVVIHDGRAHFDERAHRQRFEGTGGAGGHTGQIVADHARGGAGDDVGQSFGDAGFDFDRIGGTGVDAIAAATARLREAFFCKCSGRTQISSRLIVGGDEGLEHVGGLIADGSADLFDLLYAVQQDLSKKSTPSDR